MKKERKMKLLLAFPAVPAKLAAQMKDGKGSNNYAVMLTRGDELFVRCYHLYYDGRIEERQRYVFAKDGCFRAGSDDGKNWTIRSDFREPVFCKTSYGYSFDNSYRLLGKEAWKHSDMRYSELDRYLGNAPLEYLRLYCRHPNIEYLMKQGYASLIEDDQHYMWYGQHRISVCVDPHVDLHTNDLLKMLRLSRTEFKVLRRNEAKYSAYMDWREQMPKAKPEELLLIAQVFNDERGTLEKFTKATGLRPVRLARFLRVHNVNLHDYSDHIDQCRELGYNLHDTAFSMPHDFAALHTRLSEMIEYRRNERICKALEERIADRIALEFSQDGLLIRQPHSFTEIVREGRVLHHCVGGYAQRHAEGRLHILFIRKADAPEEPFYTMELSLEGYIIQVRGLKNCAPTEEVRAFVDAYKRYIIPLFEKKYEKVRISA